MLALILNGTDQSDETAALVDLVENGANLLRVVDCLLRDIHTLSGVSGECTLFVRVMLCIEYYILLSRLQACNKSQSFPVLYDFIIITR